MVEKIQKISVTAFILFNNKVLILKRSKQEKFLPNYYEMPGGKVEFGESPDMALIREIKEETNLSIEIIKPYSFFSYISDNNQRHTVDIQFITKIKSNEADVKLSNSHDDYKLIEVDEINNYQISDYMKIAINKGFNEIKL
ncbi:MAG: NUDIX hydrolase [Patescibacteria group bacterium]|nr:NUDIX hydrolase [Patescibacteria group bacterium]MDD4610399.1 NUDIX hydrolase [Patescibacteria group bacterium]